jgi:hypothetical protein
MTPQIPRANPALASPWVQSWAATIKPTMGISTHVAFADNTFTMRFILRSSFAIAVRTGQFSDAEFYADTKSSVNRFELIDDYFFEDKTKRRAWFITS